MKDSRFSDGALIVALTASYLYCSSMAYSHGFMGELKLDSNMLERSVHQSIYEGYFLNLEDSILYPLFMVVVLFLIGLAVTAVEIYSDKSEENRERVDDFKSHFRTESNINSRAIRKIMPFAVYPLLIFVFGYSALRFMASYEQDGISKAKDVFEDIKLGKYDKLYVHIDGTEKEYAHLYCGVRNCAGYDVESERIVYFPQEGHSVKVWKEKSKSDTENTPVASEPEAVEE